MQPQQQKSTKQMNGVKPPAKHATKPAQTSQVAVGEVEQDEPEEIVISGYLKFSKVIVWLMYFWVMIGVISLTLRVFLLAVSANMSAGFSNFVLRVSNDYLDPFRNIFVGHDVNETGYLDVSSIFAIIVYLFIAWGFHSLITYVQNKIDASVVEQKAAGRVKKLK